MAACVHVYDQHEHTFTLEYVVCIINDPRCEMYYVFRVRIAQNNLKLCMHLHTSIS